jgi:hypothetical protein
LYAAEATIFGTNCRRKASSPSSPPGGPVGQLRTLASRHAPGAMNA